VNWGAIIAAAAANMAIGALWYSPWLFGPLWLRLAGKTKAELTGQGKAMAMSAVAALVMAYVLGHFVVYLDVADAIGAASLAFWIWLGFLLTTGSESVVYEGRPKQLYVLNQAYHLVGLLAMAWVLVFWA